MASCTYCGRKAGFLRSQHKECENRYRLAWSEMVELAAEGARDERIERPLLPTLTEIAEANFMTGQQVGDALVAGWRQVVDEFLDDRLLTEDEEQKLLAFTDQYQLGSHLADFAIGSKNTSSNSDRAGWPPSSLAAKCQVITVLHSAN